MINLTPEQIAEIKRLQQESTDKLNESLEGVKNSQEPGDILNQYAPCLISHTIGNLSEILRIINQAEEASK